MYVNFWMEWLNMGSWNVAKRAGEVQPFKASLMFDNLIRQ